MRIRILNGERDPLGDWIELEPLPPIEGYLIAPMQELLRNIQFNQAGLNMCFVEIENHEIEKVVYNNEAEVPAAFQ